MESDLFLRDKLNASSGQFFIADEQEYILGGEIGTGAIGVVRRATNRKTQKPVAVKFLAPESKYVELSSLEDMAARFKREGQRGVSLSHEHLVKIIAYEENKDGLSFPSGNGPCNPFIVMECIQGTTLENFLRKRIHSGDKGKFNINPQTLFIAYSIINALRYLHKRNIVHRDVKPANIYLTRVYGSDIPEIVKLGDFGIVKWGDFKASITTGTLTVSGQPNLGTLKYMPPEQALNPKEVDVRADMYALGITLFELFTTQILPSIYHVLQLTQQRAQRGNVIAKLHSLGLGILPDEYEDLFVRIYNMLAPTPSNRPSSNDMEGRLQYYLDSLGYEHLYI